MADGGFVISGILATPVFAFRGLSRFTGVAAHQLAFQRFGAEGRPPARMVGFMLMISYMVMFLSNHEGDQALPGAPEDAEIRRGGLADLCVLSASASLRFFSSAIH